MKKILLPILIFSLSFLIACGGSKKGGTDNDPTSDGDTDDTEISDEDRPDSDEAETDITDEEKTDDDTDPAAEDPCSVNPCKNIENSTGKCIVENDYSCECKENYTWEESAWEGPRCKADQRKQKCTGLPENAQWTTVSEITQTWNGEEWAPSDTPVYNEETAYGHCYFKCLPAYTWNGEECVVRTSASAMKSWTCVSVRCPS